jgi:hypothetical protein
MDYSQYLRLKQEAAIVYVARMKPVDSSFLTMQKQQKAAYAGSAAPYSFVYDKDSCPKDHAFTEGYIATNTLSQHEDKAARVAGAVLCGSPDYSRISPGIALKNCTEVSTIRTSYNNNTPAPGQWKAYGYGQNHYFPKEDLNSQSTCCVTNKYPYPSA